MVVATMAAITAVTMVTVIAATTMAIGEDIIAAGDMATVVIGGTGVGIPTAVKR
jgi:hypothetical protein